MADREYIIGVDEAGRGPWAGPLAVSAVYAPTDLVINARDSKSLSAKRRLEHLHGLQTLPIEIGLGWASSKEIDELGLSEALRLASTRAFSHLSKRDCVIIVDGSQNFTGLSSDKLITQIKADNDVPQVSAASIVAKTFRDNWMRLYSQKHPSWHFDKHFGYGTKLHNQSIEEYGLASIHRRSYKPIARYEEYFENRSNR